MVLNVIFGDIVATDLKQESVAIRGRLHCACEGQRDVEAQASYDRRRAFREEFSEFSCPKVVSHVLDACE